MSESSREQRLQRRLYEIFPIYEFIGLTVDRAGEAVRLSVPLSANNTNHYGVMHAGVLFTLSETSGALALGQHPAFRSLTVIATSVGIEYLRAARTRVTCEVGLTHDYLDSVRLGLQVDPKFSADLGVELRDAEGLLVARSQCRFQLRTARV